MEPVVNDQSAPTSPQVAATPVAAPQAPTTTTVNKSKQPMPGYLMVIVAICILVVLGLGAYFALSYALGSLVKMGTNVGQQADNISTGIMENAKSFSSKNALSVSRGYLEALYKKDYSKAYTFLDEDFVGVKKTDWVKSNEVASYAVASFVLPEQLSVYSSDLTIVNGKSLYDLGYDVKVKRKTIFSDNYNKDAASMLVVWNKEKNTYKIVDRVAFIRIVDVEKQVSNIASIDKFKADFIIKKAYFTRNGVFFVWNYNDAPITSLPYILPYGKATLIDVNTGNSIEYSDGNIQSKDLFAFSRSAGMSSNGSFDSFWLGEGSKTDMSKIWEFGKLKFKYTPLFEIGSSPMFPDIIMEF